MKGIVLAGGSGTRLYPITKGVKVIDELKESITFDTFTHPGMNGPQE